MSKNQHGTANRHFKGSRGGRVLSKLGAGGHKRKPLWKIMQELKRVQQFKGESVDD